MKTIAATDEYTIYQKRSARYAVRNAKHQWINGADKIAILLEHKLINVVAKAPEPAVVEEAAPEVATEVATEVAPEVADNAQATAGEESSDTKGDTTATDE